MTKTTFRERCGVFAIVVASALATLAIVQSGERAAVSQSQTEPGLATYALPGSGFALAGVASGDRIWVLATDGATKTTPGLTLTNFSPTGRAREFTIPLTAGGIQAGLAAAADGALWIATGRQVVRLDPATGAVRTIPLPGPTLAVPNANKVPDGTILGWGNATSLAVDDFGDVWVARFAVPALTRVRVASGVVDEVPLSTTAVDPERLLSVHGAIWFTVNYSPSRVLNSAVGRLDPPTGSSVLFPIGASTLVTDGASISAVGVRWLGIDPITGAATERAMPIGAYDQSVSTVAAGQLVMRIARETKLTFSDEQGRIGRTIAYDEGSFQDRLGNANRASSRLAFLLVTDDRAVWFAPQGGSLIYRSP